MSHLEITQVVSVHCNIVNNNYHTIIIIIIIIIIIQFTQKNFYFQKHLIQNFHILKYDLEITVLNL